jgi:hypothetical protein
MDDGSVVEQFTQDGGAAVTVDTRIGIGQPFG